MPEFFEMIIAFVAVLEMGVICYLLGEIDIMNEVDKNREEFEIRRAIAHSKAMDRAFVLFQDGYYDDLPPGAVRIDIDLMTSRYLLEDQ